MTHESPDGDAVSSSLSVMHAIAQLGKEADVIIPEYSKDFKFLPGSEKILEQGKCKNYDLAISVDCTDLKRLVGAKEYYETAKTTIQIDHHSVNAMFADFNYVNPAAPSCCEVLISMLEYYGVEITKDLATCILTGMITDTGGFQWGGVSPETFEFAAELVRKGAKLKEICRIALRKKSKAHCELEKLVYNRLEYLENGKIALAYLTVEDYNSLNTEMGDDEGLVEMLRDIEGVEVAVLLKEKEGANGFKGSLRSHETVNVSDIALILGGGGHRGAAGCFIPGTVEQAKTKVVEAIKQELGK
jgi:phosphoesterase RecJ-like protein